MCPEARRVDTAGFRQLADLCDKAIRTLSGAHPEARMSTLTVVKDLQILEDSVRQFNPGTPPFRFRSSVCILPQKDSIVALS